MPPRLSFVLGWCSHARDERAIASLGSRPAPPRQRAKGEAALPPRRVLRGRRKRSSLQRKARRAKAAASKIFALKSGCWRARSAGRNGSKPGSLWGPPNNSVTNVPWLRPGHSGGPVALLATVSSLQLVHPPGPLASHDMGLHGSSSLCGWPHLLRCLGAGVLWLVAPRRRFARPKGKFRDSRERDFSAHSRVWSGSVGAPGCRSRETQTCAPIPSWQPGRTYHGELGEHGGPHFRVVHISIPHLLLVLGEYPLFPRGLSTFSSPASTLNFSSRCRSSRRTPITPRRRNMAKSAALVSSSPPVMPPRPPHRGSPSWPASSAW